MGWEDWWVQDVENGGKTILTPPTPNGEVEYNLYNNFDVFET